MALDGERAEVGGDGRGGEEEELRKGQQDSLVILTSPGPSGHPDSEVALLWQLA